MWVTNLYVGYNFVCGLQTFCMQVTNILYVGYKHFVCGYKRFVCGYKHFVCGYKHFVCGYKRFVCGYKRFVCGLQTFCMRLQMFCMRLQMFCMRVTKVPYVGYKSSVCGLQTFCTWVTKGLYGDYRSFVLWLQFLVMTPIDLCMMVKRFKTM